MLDCSLCASFVCFFFFKQKTAYDWRISDWSSDVCSSDLGVEAVAKGDDQRRVGGDGGGVDLCRLLCGRGRGRRRIAARGKRLAKRDHATIYPGGTPSGRFHIQRVPSCPTRPDTRVLWRQSRRSPPIM